MGGGGDCPLPPSGYANAPVRVIVIPSVGI